MMTSYGQVLDKIEQIDQRLETAIVARCYERLPVPFACQDKGCPLYADCPRRESGWFARAGSLGHH